jgi:hypothetical protein
MELIPNMNILSEIAMNIFISGLNITLISYMSIFFSPLIASIIWSFPVSLIMIAYIMSSKNQTNKEISKVFLNMGLLTIPFLFTIYAMYYLFNTSTEKYIISPIIKTIIIWFIISISYYIFIKSFGWDIHLE